MHHSRRGLFVSAVFSGLAAVYLHACNVVVGGPSPGGVAPTDAGDTDRGTTAPPDRGSVLADTGSPPENPCAGGACPRVIQLTAGDRYTCALLEDRSVRCWGTNSSGRLGDGTTVTRLRPTAVTGLMGVAQVAVGYEHTCAVKTDGTVWCWGAGTNGQLGNGANNESDVPVQVRGVTGARKVTLGRYHSCAVAGDARVRCWGRGAEASPHFFARFQRVRSPGAWKGAGNPREALPSQGCRKVTPTTGSGALRRQGFARVARAFPGAGRGSNAENSRRKK